MSWALTGVCQHPDDIMVWFDNAHAAAPVFVVELLFLTNDDKMSRKTDQKQRTEPVVICYFPWKHWRTE